LDFSVIYIFRKRLPNYFSIEGVFQSIISEVSKKLKIEVAELKLSGASPSILLRNIFSYSETNSKIKHITGDVHYMALISGRNTVLTIHDLGSAIQGNILKRFYIKLFWFWLPALFVKRITVISHFSKGELERVIPFAKRKIQVVYNPVNDCFSFSARKFNKAKPKILLFSTKPNKNLERVLMALSGLSCEVLLIGKPTADQLNLIAQLNVNVTVRSNLTLDEVVEAYKASDLLCFASTYEGFGMPIIEAQKVGRPVLSSNLGAMKEVAGDSALLVDPFDVDAIRAGLLELIENSNLRQQLIEKGLKNVERFDAERIAYDYMAIYKELSSTAKL
jgi:glycosyltransferase involved in cell wall biosynthesis